MTAAKRSTCSRAQVGAVISRQGRPLSLGYNGAPAGMPHCTHECDCGFPGEGGLLFEGKHLSSCASTQACLVSVHAEVNAIAFAARHGVGTDGGELHVTMSPCWACAQNIINSGIARVVYAEEYRNPDGLVLLRNADLAVEFVG